MYGWQNEDGEPIMDGAAWRYEQSLDAENPPYDPDDYLPGNVEDEGEDDEDEGPGVERIALTAPYSEACMHLRVAGTQVLVEPVPYGMAQLYTAAGDRISFPVSRGEAGLHPTEDRPLNEPERA